MRNSGYVFLVLWMFLIFTNILSWTTISWTLLLLPIWGPLCIILIVSLLLAILVGITGIVLIFKSHKYNDRNRRINKKVIKIKK